ncbi:PadR family transcriptional regulator [Kitasatospora viridis]|uniref:PadR family transcriptional regulator n=1 Tax=Kitasatospora viridis TaxID=281105 RepID=A0A561TTQ5_9ACTN|nr:PadR family transcriptional regulator [Kitasatospora viridis]TWF90483.1 PadR family transcriptional regulator [Kitasatospora viridis]
MPRKALDNPIVLAVLGLLLEQPAHPYQMLAELHGRSAHHAAAVTRGTLYNTVAAMAEAGWLADQGQQRSGNRPERTVYSLTEAGRAELVRRLDQQIRTPEREFSQFLGAVAYLGALGKSGALTALAERTDRLAERTAEDERRLAEVLASGMPRLFMIEAEYAIAQARSELAWLHELAEQVADGRLAWPTSPTG